MNDLTATRLFDYANRYARKRENAGKGTQYPTVRQAAKRFKVKQQDIVDICEDWDGAEGYLGIAVGFGIPGVGAGCYEGGDQLVEAYK